MNKDKKMLFEAMHKVSGMPLNEDMYTDDQVTQNFDNWHNPEQGPDMDTNVEGDSMSSEEFLVAMEKFQVNDRETLKKMNPNDSGYNFFAQSIEARQKLIDSTKKQAGMPLGEDIHGGGMPMKGNEDNRYISDEEWTELLNIRDSIYTLTEKWGDKIDYQWGFDNKFKHDLLTVVGTIHKAYMDKYSPQD